MPAFSVSVVVNRPDCFAYPVDEQPSHDFGYHLLPSVVILFKQQLHLCRHKHAVSNARATYNDALYGLRSLLLRLKLTSGLIHCRN